MAVLAAVFAFLNTTLGRWIGVVLLLGVAFAAGDIRGTRVTGQACEAAAKAAQKAADDQDLQAEKDAHAADKDVVTQLSDIKRKQDADLATLQDRLEQKPTTVKETVTVEKPVPVASPCLYGPDGGVPNSVHDDVAPTGTGDKKHPRAPVVPAAHPKASR